MSGNSYGKLFVVTSFGESHGAAIGCIVDGCPPGMELAAEDLQSDLDRRKPGTSRHTTQRRLVRRHAHVVAPEVPRRAHGGRDVVPTEVSAEGKNEEFDAHANRLVGTNGVI